MKARILASVAMAAVTAAFGRESQAEDFCWPRPTQAMRPWVYNWWMGNAIDEAGMKYQCEQLRAKGFGGFHVIPIYGAKKGYEKKWRRFLSPEWVEAWNMAVATAKANRLGVDLTMGSGWCFGGPWIDAAHANSRRVKVKRACLGGAGYMLDPFDPDAMKMHVAAFDGLFGRGGRAARPRAFYHDSYEYYGARPKREGDIDEMQLSCFRVWTDWCRENGYLTRNQAHGAPSNWLDFYALADIPETEMFGKGKRDVLISKFASSAAHVKGTTLVSAETCTWIDEHFCERPADIKEFIDSLFLSGVNHVFYHGLCYSPVEAEWPGWCFYATLEMNPRNPIWREVSALNEYVTRCQSVFQTWKPDTDLALVWDPEPLRAKAKNGMPAMSVTNGHRWFYPEKIGRLAKMLFESGYSFDYISRRMVKDGLGEKYAAVVDPEVGADFDAAMKSFGKSIKGVRRMPFNAANGLVATRWTKDGATAYFVVNTGDVARVVSSRTGSFTEADPLTGAIERNRAVSVLEPKHSLFLIGDGFEVVKRSSRSSSRPVVKVGEAWCLSPVCGGPTLPGAFGLEESLIGWERIHEFFSGTLMYSTTFDIDPSSYTNAVLSLGEVHEIARVRLCGRDIGVRFMPPYEYPIPAGLLRPTGNALDIEVTNLGANRLRWNDVNKVDWKYFCDINVVGRDYKPFDASKWKPLKSGLFGPVEVR